MVINAQQVNWEMRKWQVCCIDHVDNYVLLNSTFYESHHQISLFDFRIIEWLLCILVDSSYSVVQKEGGIIRSNPNMTRLTERGLFSRSTISLK